MLSFSNNITSGQKSLDNQFSLYKNKNSYETDLITESEMKEILLLSTYFPKIDTQKSKKSVNILA